MARRVNISVESDLYLEDHCHHPRNIVVEYLSQIDAQEKDYSTDISFVLALGTFV